MKKVFALLLCLVLASTVLVACQEEEVHTHTYTDEWRYDATDHWRTATCEHVDEVADKGAHVDADQNDICDVCGYIADHTHWFENGWAWNESTHYHKAACGHNVKKDETKHEDTNNDAICDICTYDYDHTHTYDEVWVSVDETGHWHAPTCGHNVAGSDKGAHADANNDGDCDDCGYNGGHEHTYASEWTHTDDEHWREVTCGHTVSVAEKGVHADENGDTTCDVCGFTPEHFHTFEEGWTADVNSHWHPSSCGHDVKKDESGHSGFESDGICDVCSFVVFHLYTVTVEGPEFIKVTAPDGTVSNSFIVKENIEVFFTVEIPDYAKFTQISGATVQGDPTQTENALIYTFRLAGVNSDTNLTVTAPKVSTVEVIVADGKGCLTIEGAFKYAYEDITFNAPIAGKYAIFSTTNPDIPFGIGEMGEDGYPIYDQVYIMNVDVSGDVTVQSRYFPWSVPEGGTMEYTYTVIRVDESLTLTSLVSDGYTLPTNVDTTIYFTAPKAGRYQISSSILGMAWNDYICNSIILEATEDNQLLSFTVRYENSSVPSFAFDCTIVSMEPDPVKLGDNTVTAPYGQYKAIEFVAANAGSYQIKAANPYFRFYIWNETTETMNGQGTTYTVEDMKIGQRVLLFLGLDTFDYDGTDDITDIVSVNYLGYIPPMENGAYAALTDTPNTYVNDEDASIILLTVQNGNQISLDGNTWQDSIEVYCEAYGSVTYWVKSSDGDSEVTVSIQFITYEFTLSVGTQVQSMVPGKEYAVYLAGSADPAYYVDYVLSWNNADVTASYNTMPLTSGGTVDGYSEHYALILIYNGSETADVAFTLTDPYVDDTPDIPAVPTDATLSVGNNSILVVINNFYCEGTRVSFTAPATATYILSAAADEANATVYLVSANGDEMEMISLPYEFSVEEGDVVLFHVSTADVMSAVTDTIELVVEVK